MHLVYTMFIPYLSLVYTIPAGHCADCPRYHFVLEDPSDVPLGECWVTLPQLFLTCHLRSTDGKQPKARHAYAEHDIRVVLVFYSTFEKLDLPCSGQIEKLDVSKNYKPTPKHTLYVGQVSDVLPAVPGVACP